MRGPISALGLRSSALRAIARRPGYEHSDGKYEKNGGRGNEFD